MTLRSSSLALGLLALCTAPQDFYCWSVLEGAHGCLEAGLDIS
jgi:hypothetical protein